MEKFKIPKNLKSKLDKVCVPLVKGESVSKTMVKSSTSYFAYHQLNLKPYLWQFYALEKLDSGVKRAIFTTCRQYLGKSTMLAIYALKSAIYNTSPSPFTNNKTRIGIISSTESQSKKLISDIRELMYRGDEWIFKITNGKVKSFFTSQLSNTKNSKNSQSEITFENGCKIVSLPPTPRVRGYTFTILMIDEGAFIEDDNFFYDIALPTISKTDGQLILTSTPNGKKGFFYELFDPDETVRKETDYPFFKMWLDWTYIEDEREKEKVKALRDLYYSTGRKSNFDQEYNALFTVSSTTFFTDEQIQKLFDPTESKLLSFSKQCDLGIDFGGMGHSKTVLTITYLNENKVIHRIYHYKYQDGDEINLIDDISVLMKSFNIQRIIPDDCPEGYLFIKEMNDKGWNVKPMKFRTDKISKYTQFRAKLSRGEIKSYPDEELKIEMQQLEEIEGIRNTQIRPPNGGYDDMIDSFIMSSYFYLDDINEFKVYTPEDIKGVKPSFSHLSRQQQIQLRGGLF